MLAIVNWPVATPAAVGASWMLIVADCPGLNGIGNVVGAMVKPVPVTVAPLTVTVARPVDVSVTIRVVVTLTGTSPKATLAAPMPRVGSAAFNCKVKVSVTGPAHAVRIAVWAVETAVTFNVNCVLDVFGCTNAAVVVVTAALLLEMPTLKPAAGAGPLSVTVHTSVPVPPIDALAQVKAERMGSPEPLSGIVAVPLMEELLETLNWPVSAPKTVGEYCTRIVADCPGFNVTGNVPCVMLKSAPVTVAALTVTGAVPVELSVTV